MRIGIIKRRPLLWGLLILLVAMVGGLATWPSLSRRLAWTFGWSVSSNQSQGALETLGEYGEVPDFALTERGGRQVTRADLLGKVWIVDFFYTECPDTCPLQSANMARLQDALAQEPDVCLVSISVDPEHDTPEVLSEYAARFGADPDRWIFLTGSRDAIYRLAIEGFHLGVVDRGEQTRRETGEGLAWLGRASAWAHPVPNADRKPVLHSSRFVLVDRQAQLRGYYHGTDWESLDRLQANVKIVLREPLKER
jgi:protein SCO1/2